MSNLSKRMAAVENATIARIDKALDYELSIMPEPDKRRIYAEYQRTNDPMVITRVMCEMLDKHGLLQAFDVLKYRRVDHAQKEVGSND